MGINAMTSKIMILLVDDDPNFLEIFGTKLRASGYEVAVAASEEEALAQTEKIKPQLILMDIRMPNATGTDAALAIKQNPKIKDTPIAFLTSQKKPWPGFASAENEAVAKERGRAAFLEKTDDLDVLVKKGEELLQRPK